MLDMSPNEMSSGSCWENGYCLQILFKNRAFTFVISLILLANIAIINLAFISAYSSNGRRSLSKSIELTSEYLPEDDDLTVITDACSQYRREARMDRPKALDILDNTGYIAENDAEGITLVTHLSNDRLDRLITIMKYWDGPIAATIHSDEQDVNGLLRTIEEDNILTSRQNLQLHIVQRQGELYPVNYLRNIGFNSSVTKYIFPVDVDLIPTPGAYATLLKYAHTIQEEIFIVPAFQETDQKWNILSNFPKSKDELITLWDKEKVIPFLGGVGQCKKCHKPTDFTQWRNVSEPYWVQYKRYFEPYIIGNRDEIPRFSQLYGGRYKDKISFVEEIYAKGLKFNVVPDVFLLHLWHEKSDQFNELWNKCSNLAEEQFENYLKETYPNFVPWW